MAANLTTVSIDRVAAEQFRLARLDMSAAERRQLSNSDVIRGLIETWRKAVDKTAIDRRQGQQ